MVERMAKLGDTADEVAESLRDAGIKGEGGFLDCAGYPLAVWARQQEPRAWIIDSWDGPEEPDHDEDYSPFGYIGASALIDKDEGGIGARLSWGLNSFVICYDGGVYPDLVPTA